jgi:hypothetical protein
MQLWFSVPYPEKPGLRCEYCFAQFATAADANQKEKAKAEAFEYDHKMHCCADCAFDDEHSSFEYNVLYDGKEQLKHWKPWLKQTVNRLYPDKVSSPDQVPNLFHLLLALKWVLYAHHVEGVSINELEEFKALKSLRDQPEGNENGVLLMKKSTLSKALALYLDFSANCEELLVAEHYHDDNDREGEVSVTTKRLVLTFEHLLDTYFVVIANAYLVQVGSGSAIWFVAIPSVEYDGYTWEKEIRERMSMAVDKLVERGLIRPEGRDKSIQERVDKFIVERMQILPPPPRPPSSSSSL